MQFPVAACRRTLPALVLAAGLGFPAARAEPGRIVPPLPEPPLSPPQGTALDGTRPLGRDFATVPIFPRGQRLVVSGAPRSPQPAGGRSGSSTPLLIVALGLGSTALAVWCSLRGRGVQVSRSGAEPQA